MRNASRVDQIARATAADQQRALEAEYERRSERLTEPVRICDCQRRASPALDERDETLGSPNPASEPALAETEGESEATNS
jgi:hypothetical protein